MYYVIWSPDKIKIRFGSVSSHLVARPGWAVGRDTPPNLNSNLL